MSEALDVYLDQNLVGRLWQERSIDGALLHFQYFQNWCDNPHAYPISMAMPLKEGAYSSDSVKTFIKELLPRDTLLKRLLSTGYSHGEGLISLLHQYGWESAGAIRFQSAGHAWPAPSEPVILTRPEWSKLSRKDLPKPISVVASEVFEGRVKQILPGQQNKLGVAFQSNRVCIAFDGALSTHIIKLGLSKCPHIAVNEAYCMLWAKALGVKVPDSFLIRDMYPVLCVKRYDRESGHAIHQESLGQAMGVLPDALSIKDCFLAIRQISTLPGQDQKSLLTWLIFNYLMGNTDISAKNINFILSDQGPRLAPFCGLSSTAVYHSNVGEKMQWEIGGEFFENRLFKSHWEQFAEDIGVKPRLVFEIMASLCKKIKSKPVKYKVKLKTTLEENSLIERIYRDIQKRAVKLEVYCNQ